MNSSQVFLAKSIPQALVKDVDLVESISWRKGKIVWKNLPEKLANYAVGLFSRQ